MGAPLRLSVLDQSPIRKGGTAAQAVAETLALAQLCDRLGYHRYWLAEHHSSEALAGSTPEVLITRVAALTNRMRIGSGGVMLPHYSAFKVAENFRMLETLFPGRIDLGIGRAPGSDQRTLRVLADGRSNWNDPASYPYQVRDLVAWLHDALPEDHVGRGVTAQPSGPTAPAVWLLGSSDESAALAAHFGLPFCFAHFINPDGGDAATRAYRAHFRPSALHAEPAAMMAITVLCAETDEEAALLATSREVWAMRLLARGEAGPVPTVEEALVEARTPEAQRWMPRLRRRSVVGSPRTAREGLERHAASYQVDEIMAVTICYDFGKRKRSYELLAEEFGLAPS
ncbi:LLM class flavin-dependent oxidoreductase [Enhydrobacter sp.]|jgi:luciferase family oxidoreductase group 1|uniref:LLM class flavin-dependent oxidoreductase n=1 Tax=Enhydrobacter sp. TaxID=1894999 RepID=UPI0026103A07|nr:LLM class flavin-dependent oxidoreductase [Enhydrobacter sp.]WIM11858.1 MAG: Luciferase-like monooxygenase YhbW [Enhydrobacter sp.]